MVPTDPVVPTDATPNSIVTQLVPLARITASVRGGAVSIGNFDGVHVGHAALLRRVRRMADRVGGPAVAVAFDPHPAAVLRPEAAPAKLTWLERRAELLAPHGIDFLVVCEVTAEFLRMSAARFFDDLIVGRLAARGIVEGPNFYFGRDRQGDVTLLKTLCERQGVELEIADPTPAPNDNGHPMVSSTRIRKLVARGEIEVANRSLGHPHRIRGRVVTGDRRGREIGFPTANLADVDVLLPAPGVYGGTAIVSDGARHPAAIHLGPRPTFDAPDTEAPKVEVHLLDYSGDLYGQRLQVDLLTQVRDIARFDSAEQLVEQLQRDVLAIRRRWPTLDPER